MVNEEKEISLGQLLSVFKKSLKRAAIYVLVSVVVAASVLFTVQGFTGIKTYASSITFSTAESNTISSLNAAKANVVNLALIDSNQSLELSQDVVKSLSVTGIIPEKNEKDDSFIPTSYEITLKPNANLDLSTGEYNTIVDNIAKHYVNIFSSVSLPQLSFMYNAEQELDHVEYMQASITLGEYVQSYIDSINSYASSNSQIKNFVDMESGKSIQYVLNTLSSIYSAINSLNNTIVLNNVEKETTQLKNYLEFAKANAAADATKYSAELADAKAAFDKYVASPSVQKDENGITYITYNDTLYKELWESIKSASSKASSANAQAEKLDSYVKNIASVTCTDSDKTYVKNSIVTLANNVNDVMSDYNDIASKYNDNQYLSSSATINRPAHTVVENILSTKVLIIAIVAVALIAYIVAFSKTYSIVKANLNEEPAKK